MKTILSVLFLLVCFIVNAQNGGERNGLAPDQNPNYMQSQAKYMRVKDSLIGTENTTAQQTYKAYDWYQEKIDNRNARQELRREIRLANAYNYNNYNDGYYNNYNNGYYNNYNSYGGYYGYQNNWYNVVPHVGYRTGNWRFWY
ncbi:hypothetical protein [Parasediminibacterium sp. JCM 36343]|uniref:hypothetical protein n=1 Tax=Parasediminibacterium sp. JCM 36343 TaxID=3374279 RepID=UPI0039799134